MFEYFRGRFRPFVVLLEDVLMGNKKIKDTWKHVLEILTSDEEDSFFGIQKTFYKLIKDIDEERSDL